MNDLTHSKTQYPGSSLGELTIELAKMLALVAPTSMTTDQQELWLRAAVDSLEDIRADEVRAVSAEVRRSVTRHNQIVPAIAEKVAELRKRKAENARFAAMPRVTIPEPPRREMPRLTQEEVDKMQPYIRRIGLRTGFLVERDGKVVPA